MEVLSCYSQYISLPPYFMCENVYVVEVGDEEGKRERGGRQNYVEFLPDQMGIS
jgi:hypothetical protein